jgi:predicted NBD/HSP70 family sugar kinase
MRSSEYSAYPEPFADSATNVSSEQRVIHRIARSDGLTRKELADELKLPSATVVTVVAKLVVNGVLAEQGDRVRRNKAGRRPGVLVLAGSRPIVGVLGWNRLPGGADVMRATLLSYGGEILAQYTMPFDVRTSAIDDLEPALRFLRSGVGSDIGIGADGERPTWLTGVVVGVPAPFRRGAGAPASDRTGSGRPQFASWLGGDPAPELARRLGVSVLVENDANLAAAGEFSAGAALGHHDVVCLRLDEFTVGAGLIINDRLFRGASGFAGEIAHIHVDDSGPLCACGGRGCLAGLLGPALVDSIQPVYEDTLTFEDILRLAISGDPGPSRVLVDVGRILGRRLADLCTFLNPSAVVIGGSLGVAAELVMTGVREQLDLYAPPIVSSAVKTMISEMGPKAELIGAIHVARAELEFALPPDYASA